jgi:very-short-patch-repair endonuclease
MNCYDNNKRGQSNKLNNEIILERYKKVWNNKYDYSKTNYINQITPITVICKKHGEFSINPRYHEKGSGCPKCYPTTELYVLDYLKNYYPTNISQFKLDSCKNKVFLRFDYCIPEIKIIIELDGEQHFKQVGKWKSCKLQLERDIYKMNKAHQEGYKIIRITQMDVFKYKEKWLENNLLPEIKSTDRNHIFISSDDTIYDKHIEMFEK